MEARDIFIVAVMAFSAIMLTYKWLSLYDNVDAGVIFFAFLLTLSLGALIISLESRMMKMKDEFESLKRAIAVNSDDLEERLDTKFEKRIKLLDERLERIEKRIYR
jgi:hypothetical protein